MRAINSKNQTLLEVELQIWEELKKGSTLALGSLYELYIDDLFSYGISFDRDRGYVMDCIHDLFFDLYKYRTKLARTDNVKSYLFISLQRKIKKKYSRKILPLPVDYTYAIDNLQNNNYIPPFEENIVSAEKAYEKTAKLTVALETLTKKQKKGLLLRFTENKTYEEIAEIMKTSIPTARTTIYRALKMLRKQPLSLLILLHFYFFS